MIAQAAAGRVELDHMIKSSRAGTANTVNSARFKANALRPIAGTQRLCKGCACPQRVMSSERLADQAAGRKSIG
jgi:hypothetical protein